MLLYSLKSLNEKHPLHRWITVTEYWVIIGTPSHYSESVPPEVQTKKQNPRVHTRFRLLLNSNSGRIRGTPYLIPPIETKAKSFGELAGEKEDMSRQFHLRP